MSGDPRRESTGADGRFAPSPSGPLHLGNLRTALVAWLFARAQGAAFRMRVEDLDPQRSRPEFARAQLDDLLSLGIDWDGPIIRQSERGHAYERAIVALENQQRLYPCFCTRAEIREAASAPHGELPDGAYPGTCRGLSSRQRDQRIAAGRPYALRLDAGAERIGFTDRLQGEQGFVVDDFVVRRADGVPAYQLAVVVDDAEQRIGEVVRGDDLLSSTPRQILLQRLLGLAGVGYAHIGVVLGDDGERLAKRHGPVTLAARGEPPAETLALLARTLGLDASGAIRAGDLLPEFRPDRLPRESVRLAADLGV